MPVTEYYIDVTGGTDTLDPGYGTVGNPWATLSFAMTIGGASTSGTRYNVKNTTSGSPHTTTGTLPAGSASKPVYIAPYSTAAGDTADPLYLSGGGSIIWDQDGIDNINFVDCHFSNYGAGYAFNLDNKCAAYRCTFDGGSGTGAGAGEWDYDGLFYNCHFKNMESIVHPTTDTSWYFNTIEWSGDYAGYITEGKVYIGNRVKMASGSVNAVFKLGYNAMNLVLSNSLYMTTGSNDDYGILTQTNTVVQHNYIENAAIGIYNYGKGGLVQDNTYYNCTANHTTRSTTINLKHPTGGANDITLAATGLPDIASVDFTPSTELRDSTTTMNEDLSGQTTGIKQQFGSVLNVPSGGLSYIPRLREE